MTSVYEESIVSQKQRKVLMEFKLHPVHLQLDRACSMKSSEQFASYELEQRLRDLVHNNCRIGNNAHRKFLLGDPVHISEKQL